jgi:feruloyl esterase
MCTLLRLAAFCLVTLFAPGVAGAATTGSACADLAALRIDDANFLSASVVPAAANLPGHCRVLGVIRPAINFEVRLPTRDWNGKFYMAGCGGFCGRLDSDLPGFTNAMNHGLRRGYAAATMDSGHWGAHRADGRWAWNNRLAENDWGWRGVTETARVAKALIAAFYARPQSKSYFAGCSTGGRMALMAAQRFPADFDGIIAGAPALDYSGLVGTHGAWVTQANLRPDGTEILDRSKVALIATAVVTACDAGDGRSDGVIDDPRNCDWQPSSLTCGRETSATCLTPAEIGVLERWYAGPRDASGQQLYPGGIPRGSEPYWPLWLTGKPGDRMPGLVPLFAQDYLRYMAFADDPGESHRVQDFDFERDPPRLEQMGTIYNADNPDLSAFAGRGGKLIVYHGWADPIVTPWRTLNYVEDVQRRMGRSSATDSFLRLFMLPGFDHCGVQTGPGANDAGFDPLPALEAWVERGIAPASIPSARIGADGAVQWSQTVCPYPKSAGCGP